MKTSLEQYSKEDHGIYQDNIDKDVIEISDALISNGYQAFLVGGCIRDILLGKKPKDFDIATDANPAEICKIFKNSRVIGRRFKIVHVYTSEKKYFEVTTFRSEASKKNHSNKFKKSNGMIKRDNVFGTISQDAFRRDFTANSLYLDLDSEILHDYVNGINDIKNKKLKLIKKPAISYQEDPVRMLRAVRFESKLDLELTDDCREAISKMAYMINNVSPFRLFDEVLKIMHSGNAVTGYKKLLKFNLFKYLFPYTHDIMEKNHIYDDFFVAALKNTDTRIKDNLHVNPSFIYAVFLWPYFKKLEQKYSQKNSLGVDLAFQKTIDSQAKYIAIPNFFQSTISTIWSLQDSFLNLSSRNIQYLTNLHKFRAAYDFFYIRSTMDDNLKIYADKWHEIQKKVVSKKSNQDKKRYGKRNRK
ncbi:MAG: polynucleotide adenylyltransferase PcnB [Gammaproteobacteria bacterium]|jgi:poly(A) polymerase|nr:polynucleotide adenylyltransferase PcnB [Gammaproteobacteria bacterium]MBT7603144.1 polynucleotide adenylyltransferase PcnB [Gammaproteobacteria bacterium]